MPGAELLVKNYDGRWTEYGSPLGAPIELGN